ncbi:transmembrane protein 248 isoform X2 [Nerophis lumbriciformis]|uniref:transmembrane protein 248 isoform X2 n=1 Tax=Nerophis lumbriciformis TaxID=546530 RepID=UPI002ADFBF9A|nr:transmembrane protein 248-like isoform X2 [Nerophis lumbriciformis]
MMAFWHLVSNLREYVSQNPPAVTFCVCILTLAMSFISLGSYINTHTLSNPDTTAKDWNHLLATLSQFHLCVKVNQSSDEPVFLTKEEKDRTTPSLDSTIQTPSVIRLYLKIPVDVTSSHGLPKDVDLYTTMTASQLHLGGNEIVALKIQSENDTCTCLTIKAQADLLPMSLPPPECPAPESNLSPVHVEAINHPPAAPQACYALLSRNDPTLTVMLTKEEQDVVVRHLIEVSVCLIGICLAASLAHLLTRSYNRKGLDLQIEPLIDT